MLGTRTKAAKVVLKAQVQQNPIARSYIDFITRNKAE